MCERPVGVAWREVPKSWVPDFHCTLYPVALATVVQDTASFPLSVVTATPEVLAGLVRNAEAAASSVVQPLLLYALKV